MPIDDESSRLIIIVVGGMIDPSVDKSAKLPRRNANLFTVARWRRLRMTTSAKVVEEANQRNNGFEPKILPKAVSSHFGDCQEFL